MKNKNNTGVFIPIEVLQDNRLDFFEKTLYSMYKAFTEHGKDKCCHLTYSQINEMFGGEISDSRYHRAKRKLVELGLIITDGGIRTKTVKGVSPATGEGCHQRQGAPVINDTHNK